MKKLFFSALWIFWLSVNLFSANLISNSDFELGTAATSSYWSPFATLPGVQTLAIDNTSQISGTNSMKVSIGTTAAYIYRLGFFQYLTLPKQATYTVSFKAKASANIQVQSNLVQSFPDYSTIGGSSTTTPFAVTTTAQTFTYDITITSSSTGLCKLQMLYGAAASGTTLYFDDITVVEKTNLTNYNLCNGDFELVTGNAINTGSYYSANGVAAGTTPTSAQSKYYDGWSFLKYVHAATTADMTAGIDSITPLSGKKSIKLTSIGTASSSSADLVLSWLTAGQKDKYYTVSFKAKATVPTAMDLYLGAASSTTTPSSDYIVTQSCNLTTDPQTFSYSSTNQFEQAADPRLLFKFLLGKVPNGVSIWIDDISLVQGISVTGITVSPTPVVISVGSALQLSATIKPANASNQLVSWISSDITKATVSATGLVTCLDAGSVTLSATSQDGGFVGTSQFNITNSAVAVTDVAVSPAILTLNTGATQKLSAVITPVGATNQAVNWKSNNLAVVNVDANGLLTGIGFGTTTVTATSQDGAFVGTSTVSVVIPVTGFGLNATSGQVSIGTPFQLYPIFTPLTATNKTITYSSNKPSVASVNATGLVSGLTPGTVIITAKTQDGSFKVADTLTVYGSNLILPKVLSSNMVMQQDMQAAVWGWGPPNQVVTITASWGQSASTTADANGRWKTKIQTPKAIAGDVQTKHTLSFVGKNNTVTLSNILIGDVYLCSGQSNMGFAMQANISTKGVIDYTNEIAAANYPNIRINKSSYQYTHVPMEDNNVTWYECNPTNVAAYSAVAYYFARELYNNKAINIPIGLMTPAVGGSCCQAWTSREALAVDTLLKKMYLDPVANDSSLDYCTRPLLLYNGMIAPLAPFSLKGFLWYQGEANASTDWQSSYAQLNKAMIKDWRALWGQGNLPFYFVQLCSYNNNSLFTGIRDQQCNVLTLPNTGMAVTLDLADVDSTNIHPRNKKDVGKRLARIAAANLYGQNICYAGPVFKSKTIEASKIRISFHPATIGSGLASRNGLALNNFKIAGSDGVYVAATAAIDGNDVLVSASTVVNPVNVAYAYTNLARANLMNKDSLTACPFKTDTWNNSISFGSVISENNVVKADVTAANVTIFPVPATDVLHVEFNKPLSNVQIELLDINGKIRYNTTLSTDVIEKRIDLTGCAKGFYICRVVGKDVNFSKSFVIQ